MRTALFTLVFQHRSLDEAIRMAAEVGYEAVELLGREPHLPADTSQERARRIKRVADGAGLRVACLATYTGGYSTKTDAECLQELVNLEKCLKLAVILDCPLIRHDPGGPSALVAGPEERARAMAWMRKAAEVAQGYGKKLAMEIHNNSLVETADAAALFLEELGADNVGVIHDAGNMYITDTDYGAYSVQRLGDRIFHVHVKDELRVEDDSLPRTFRDRTRHGEEIFQHNLLGEGAVDHLQLFTALVRAGYGGYLSAECHGTPDDRATAVHELAEIRRLVAQATGLARAAGGRLPGLPFHRV